MEPRVAHVQRGIDGLEWLVVYGDLALFPVVSETSPAVDHKTVVGGAIE